MPCFDTSDNKKKLISALIECKGIVSDACRKVAISRDTHYRWLKEDGEYKSEVESIDDTVIDFVEGKLFDRIKEGDTTSIIFYLKTKAKRRGYIEKVQQELSGGDTPIQIEGKHEVIFKKFSGQ